MLLAIMVELITSCSEDLQEASGLHVEGNRVPKTRISIFGTPLFFRPHLLPTHNYLLLTVRH